MLHITEVRPTGAYRLWVAYSDGLRGEVDLAEELCTLIPLLLVATTLQAHTTERSADWPVYGGSEDHPHYSTLSQIAVHRAAERMWRPRRPDP